MHSPFLASAGTATGAARESQKLAGQPLNGAPSVDSPAQAAAEGGERGGEVAAASILALTSTTLFNERYSANRLGIPFGAIVTPLPDLRAPLPVIRRLPVACTVCCAVINTFCEVDPRTGRWRCVFCGHESSDHGLLGSMAHGAAELRSQAVDYVTPAPEGSSPPPATVALVLDATPDAGDLEALKSAALQVIGKLPRRTRLLLVSYAAAVSVWRLGNGGTEPPSTAAADVFPGHAVADAEALSLLRESAAQGGCIAPLHACRAAAEAAVQALRPMSDAGPSSERPRCLGAAIHATLYLLREFGADEGGGVEALPGRQGMTRSGLGSGSGRVLIVTTGPTTRGPGYVPVSSLDGSEGQRHSHAKLHAHRFFSQLASFALDAGVTVDVLAIGLASVNVPLLSKIATETGGLLSLHQGAVGTLTRRAGVHGVMELHASRGLEAGRLLGSAAALDRGPGGAAAASASGFLHGPAAVELKTIERGRAVGACLDVAEPLKQPHAFIQVVVSWTAEDGSSVHRVATRRLDVTASRAAALCGTDCEIAALLLAKRTVQLAQAADAAGSERTAAKLRAGIGKQLAHIAAVSGEQLAVPGGWFGRRKLWVMPSELRFLNEALYQLQRGAMLGSGRTHPDERALLHALFVNAAPPVAIRMLAPALYLLDRASGQFTQVMPADVALWSDSAAILDHGSHMFVWLGREVAAAMPDPTGDGRWTRTTLVCERYAMRLAAGRYPIPELVTTTEGASSARHVASRLIPTHRDAPGEQEAQVPVLALLTEEQLAALAAKQPPTDEPSLLEWTRAAGVEPSLPADNISDALEGMALARANSIGLAGLRRAQSLAEKRRQHSLAVGRGQASARSMSVAANEPQKTLDKGKPAEEA